MAKLKMEPFPPPPHAYVDSSWFMFMGVNIAQKKKIKSYLFPVAEQQQLQGKGTISKVSTDLKLRVYLE